MENLFTTKMTIRIYCNIYNNWAQALWFSWRRCPY